MEKKDSEMTQFDNLSPKHVGKRTEKTLKFNNLTDTQKKYLQGGGIALGAGSLGALAILLMGATAAEGGNVVPNKHTGTENAEVKVFTDSPFASTISDSMSFNNAFDTARKEVGPGGFFEWHGQTYNTYTKEEWASMSDAQKHDFYESVDHDHDPNQAVNEEEILNALNDNEDIIIPDDLEEEIVIIEEDDDDDDDVLSGDPTDHVDDDDEEEIVIIEEDDDDDDDVLTGDPTDHVDDDDDDYFS